jgi:uncharacterized membrane protein YvlD (DUF360 family)
MTYLIITIGILYVLGAYLMWLMGDEADPDDMKMRPFFSAFWPVIVICSIVESLINKDE